MTYPILPKASDKEIYDVWFTRYQLPALALAVDLKIFDFVKNGINNVHLLASQLKVEAKGVDSLCTLIAAMGYIEKNKDIIKLNDISATYFVSDSIFFWGVALGRVQTTTYYVELRDAICKTDGYHLASGGKTFTKMWETANITSEAAENFTAVMHCTIFYAAMAAVKDPVFSSIRKLVDVGAGSGCFAISFLSQHPESSAIVFEIPVVTTVTRKYIEKFKLTHKVDIVPGNFFKDAIPEGDAILFSNILHDWQPEHADLLLRKAYDALPENGCVIINEMLLDESKNGPLASAAFNLLMYINHRSQQFTFQELATKLYAVGFRDVGLKKHHPNYSLIVAYKRKM